MKKKTIAINLMLLAIFLLLGRQEKATAAPLLQGQNLLNNPSFEQPYSDGTAQGWNRWHQETPKGDAGCESGYHYLPKWLIETNGDLVADGVTSQKVGNTWDTWHAGVFQTVDVTPGETYRFTALARGRATNDNYPQPSEGGINLNVQVGIDPNGSGTWSDGDIVWSGTGSPHDTWQTFSVEATATGNKMTVFTSANLGVPGANQCRRYMDVWFDKAELVSVAPAVQPTSPPPPPQQEATPVPPPTATPLPEPTAETVPAEPTAEPTQTEAEASPAADISSGGTICINAFDDVNSSGQRDGTEGFMPGVTFILVAANGEAERVISAGTEDPHCFSGLEPGLYQVAQQVPGQLQMTTAANTTVEAVAGSTTAVSFGSRSRSGLPVATAPSGSEAVAQGGDSEPPVGDQPMVPTSGGMICVNAFHDENNNGLHEENEGYMAGVTLLVSGDAGVTGQTVSEGSATPYCLDNLQPGNYEISQQVPNRVVGTTAENALVSLAEGKTIGVEFGSRLDVENSGSDTTVVSTAGDNSGTSSEQPAQSSSGSSNLVAYGGLAVIVLAVVVLGGLIFYFLRR